MTGIFTLLLVTKRVARYKKLVCQYYATLRQNCQKKHEPELHRRFVYRFRHSHGPYAMCNFQVMQDVFQKAEKQENDKIVE